MPNKIRRIVLQRGYKQHDGHTEVWYLVDITRGDKTRTYLFCNKRERYLRFMGLPNTDYEKSGFGSDSALTLTPKKRKPWWKPIFNHG